MPTKLHKASCHCGAVAIEAEFDLMEGTGRCNCSICKKARWWGKSVKPDQVRAIHGAENTFGYQFASHAIDLRYCKTCGLRVYGKGYVKEIGGDFVAINVACLDTASDEELAAAPIHYSNGRDNDWMHEPKVKAYL